jgi:hypothetical protein
MLISFHALEFVCLTQLPDHGPVNRCNIANVMIKASVFRNHTFLEHRRTDGQGDINPKLPPQLPSPPQRNQLRM